ncbi:MAG: hypothetical protein AAFO69_01255 [Bacteroidota bacterium]
MKEEELIQIWKNSIKMNQIKVNLPLLVSELRSKMEKFDSKIRQRDLREVMASVIGMVLFLSLAVYIPYLWSKIACILMVIWFGYVIYKLKSTSKTAQPNASLPLSEQLQARKEYLGRQMQLLLNVPYWYILPPFVINLIFFAGVGDPALWDSPLAAILPYETWEKVIVLLFLTALYTYVTWINLKAARTEFPPLIKQIERTRAELLKSE